MTSGSSDAAVPDAPTELIELIQPSKPAELVSSAGSDADDEQWSIAQVADLFEVTHRTVRHYEELGLISPERRGTQRLYHRRDRTRLALVLRGKRLGFPLEQIRTIIDLFDAPRGRATQLEYVLGQIEERRRDLDGRLRDVQDTIDELARFEQRCRTDLDRLDAAHGTPTTSADHTRTAAMSS